uniref:Uncharacterized protein n=1 Tax=Timema shepardi TaxID=629360 RepID=A0A7R9FVW2_TIMSH|nr:unnamed protein product [Timema shepardi]
MRSQYIQRCNWQPSMHVSRSTYDFHIISPSPTLFVAPKFNHDYVHSSALDFVTTKADMQPKMYVNMGATSQHAVMQPGLQRAMMAPVEPKFGPTRDADTTRGPLGDNGPLPGGHLTPWGGKDPPHSPETTEPPSMAADMFAIPDITSEAKYNELFHISCNKMYLGEQYLSFKQHFTYKEHESIKREQTRRWAPTEEPLRGRNILYSSPVAPLVLTDSSQLTSDKSTFRGRLNLGPFFINPTLDIISEITPSLKHNTNLATLVSRCCQYILLTPSTPPSNTRERGDLATVNREIARIKRFSMRSAVSSEIGVRVRAQFSTPREMFTQAVI